MSDNIILFFHISGLIIVVHEIQFDKKYFLIVRFILSRLQQLIRFIYGMSFIYKSGGKSGYSDGIRISNLLGKVR